MDQKSPSKRMTCKSKVGIFAAAMNVFVEKMKMKRIALYLTVVSIIFAASSVKAMTCGQFHALGTQANTISEVVNSSASYQQVEEYKKVIGPYAGRLEKSAGASPRKKALEVVRQTKLLTNFVRDSLAFTRAECLKRQSESMNDVAIQQFNYLLDGVVDELKL